METHPTLGARCVAVTSCLGKIGDGRGPGGKRLTRSEKIQREI